jgi:hypothetical protein
MVRDHRTTIVCLQETKVDGVDDHFITETIGPQFVGEYAALPADHTRGGITVSCSVDFFLLQEAEITQHSISVKI